MKIKCNNCGNEIDLKEYFINERAHVPYIVKCNECGSSVSYIPNKDGLIAILLFYSSGSSFWFASEAYQITILIVFATAYSTWHPLESLYPLHK